MEKQNLKAWLYLLPAFLFLGAFMIYPLIDVFVYSFEEGYNSASQTFYGIGMYNYSYVLHDPYFLQALKNTFILVIITVPVSTGLALLISAALSSIKPLRDLFQTIFFLPYVTNTLAVGLVFMILFKKTPYSDGLINLLIQFFGGSSVDFIDGPYWAKMFVLCFYTIWIVMPFKILILTSALASVNPMYYNAARVDGTSRFRMFTKITLPMISPMVFYLIITGFIGAFKAYSDAVALFGTNLNAAEMNTIVGYVYDMLYGDSGGYPSYASAAVTDRDGVRYILKTWWEGRECNIRDREECMEAMRLLARLHGDLEFTPVFPETEETSAPVIERYLPSRDYEKHNRELKRARRFLKQRSQKTWFEIRLSAVIDPFLEEARQLCEEWKEIELAASDSGDKAPLCFCHGDYQYHNILRQDRGFFLVNFEKCQADGPVRDLYLLLRKLLEKSEWDAEWGRVLLAAYESVRPLKPYERQDLFYRLSYPEKLWKIVNFYYNSGKAWIPEKNQEKLDRLLEQEAARKKFLKLLQR